MSRLNLLSRHTPDFPPVDNALSDPNGLLAVGGELSPEWLIAAYKGGIFPWFNDDESPILWWSPDPRAVLVPEQLKISRSLAKRLRNGGFRVTVDTAFAEVINACARARRSAESPQNQGTWITSNMAQAYIELHEMGHAHSMEVWQADQLVGGLYGVSFGAMFFGESMFSATRDASKVALCHLARQLRAWHFSLIDCQVGNPHLYSLGAQDMPRREFMMMVEQNSILPNRPGPWQMDTFPSQSWQRN